MSAHHDPRRSNDAAALAYARWYDADGRPRDATDHLLWQRFNKLDVELYAGANRLLDARAHEAR